MAANEIEVTVVQNRANPLLLDAERLIQERLGNRRLDFDSMLAVSNIYRAADRYETDRVEAPYRDQAHGVHAAQRDDAHRIQESQRADSHSIQASQPR